MTQHSHIVEELEVQEALSSVVVDPVGKLSVFHILLCYVGREGSILACQQIVALSQNFVGRR